MSADARYTSAIASEWLRRVQAEYTSAARTHVFTHWLIQGGASPDLIRAGLRIVDDELAHAELSHAVVVEAQGAPTSPALAQENLDLRRRHDELLTDLLRRCIEIFCLGETVAVPLFSEMRKRCEVAVAREALDRILVDEVRHRDFGWTTLAWLLETHPELAPPKVEALLLPAFRRVQRNYRSAKTQSVDEDREAALGRWGLIPPSSYAGILDRCAEKDYFPRFERLGIAARPAWEAALLAETNASS
jgi:hypothetical protein